MDIIVRIKTSDKKKNLMIQNSFEHQERELERERVLVKVVLLYFS